MPSVRACLGAALLASAAWWPGCGSDSTSPSPNPPSVTAVAVTGAAATMGVGSQAALVATATFSDNTTSNVSSQAAWETSNASVATVTASGSASFVGAGDVDLKATYRGISGTAHVKVSASAPVVTGVAVTGAGATATVGQSAALTATAAYSDSTSQNVTAQATWASSNTAVATVSATGSASFVGAGEVDLRATFGGVNGALHVSVSAAGPQTFTLSGTVTDTSGNAGLGGVSVQIADGSNAGRSTSTSSNGGYSLSGLTSGSFNVQFSKSGYGSVTRGVTLSGDTQLNVGLTSTIAGFYGTYNITETVSSQTCSTPVTPGPTGTMALNGRGDGTDLSIVVTERGVSRTFVGGTINASGAFNGSFSGLLPGRYTGFHDVSGTIQGTVSGRNISATERLTYGAPCPGGTIVIVDTGSK
ncbi:MAG TPA: carboxypeptidase regulatory-like domain-containing protein [Vicinamibacterales bacterium]|nr:carboxypeptidase regulatory-like domain-containing protein [Vicinamibacterales bacterium]